MREHCRTLIISRVMYREIGMVPLMRMTKRMV
jgi:hypothetical protein